MTQRISSDAARVAVGVKDDHSPRSDLGLRRGSWYAYPLSSTDESAFSPVWSPDNKWIAYRSWLARRRPSGSTHRMAQGTSGKSAATAAITLLHPGTGLPTAAIWSSTAGRRGLTVAPRFKFGQSRATPSRCSRLRMPAADSYPPTAGGSPITGKATSTVRHVLSPSRSPRRNCRWRIRPALACGWTRAVFHRARSRAHRGAGASDGPRVQGHLFPSAISAVAIGRRLVLRCHGGRPAVSGQCADPSAAVRAADGDYRLASPIQGGIEPATSEELTKHACIASPTRKSSDHQRRRRPAEPTHGS